MFRRLPSFIVGLGRGVGRRAKTLRESIHSVVSSADRGFGPGRLPSFPQLPSIRRERLGKQQWLADTDGFGYNRALTCAICL
jgi:hypothetical protein